MYLNVYSISRWDPVRSGRIIISSKHIRSPNLLSTSRISRITPRLAISGHRTQPKQISVSQKQIETHPDPLHPLILACQVMRTFNLLPQTLYSKVTCNANQCQCAPFLTGHSCTAGVAVAGNIGATCIRLLLTLRVIAILTILLQLPVWNGSKTAIGFCRFCRWPSTPPFGSIGSCPGPCSRHPSIQASDTSCCCHCTSCPSCVQDTSCGHGSWHSWVSWVQALSSWPSHHWHSSSTMSVSGTSPASCPSFAFSRRFFLE